MGWFIVIVFVFAGIMVIIQPRYEQPKKWEKVRITTRDNKIVRTYDPSCFRAGSKWESE